MRKHFISILKTIKHKNVLLPLRSCQTAQEYRRSHLYPHPKKTSWNNRNTVSVIQRRGPSGSDRLQKSAKSLPSALQLMSISQIRAQKYGSGHFEPFKITNKKLFPISF